MTSVAFVTHVVTLPSQCVPSEAMDLGLALKVAAPAPTTFAASGDPDHGSSAPRPAGLRRADPNGGFSGDLSSTLATLVPPALALPAWICNRSLLQLNLPHPPAIKLAVTARMLHLMGIWHLFSRVQGGRCREAADVDAIVPVMLYFDFFVSISHLRLQCCT